jgi:hypothetical protein
MDPGSFDSGGAYASSKRGNNPFGVAARHRLLERPRQLLARQLIRGGRDGSGA